MNYSVEIHGDEPPPTWSTIALTGLQMARLALVIVVAAFILHDNTALGAEFTLQDGNYIEGDIVYASRSSVIIRKRTGALVQLGRRAIDRIGLKTDKRGIVAGTLEGWAKGVYTIRTEGNVFRVQRRQIISEQRIIPKIIVTSAKAKENAEKLVFGLSLSTSVDQEVLLIYSTEDGTALAGSDYEARHGSVILQPGSTDALVIIQLLDDDLAEGDETFGLRVTSDVDLATIKVVRGSGTILDNEALQGASQEAQ